MLLFCVRTHTYKMCNVIRKGVHHVACILHKTRVTVLWLITVGKLGLFLKNVYHVPFLRV